MSQANDALAEVVIPSVHVRQGEPVKLVKVPIGQAVHAIGDGESEENPLGHNVHVVDPTTFEKRAGGH
jgi:hypothetical protein